MARWPRLPYDEWRPTRDTLHMYMQVVGKLRLALSPFEPQWGHVPFYVTARGLTTSPLPSGPRTFDVEFDLVGHELVFRTCDGTVERRPLGGDVADFYHDVVRILERLGVEAAITPMPQEVEDPIPFPEDHEHGTYVGAHAERFFRVLSLVDVVMKEHRARFRGRTSPVHFFWGTFDLALTRYSGRDVEPPAGAGLMRRVGGDAEQICCGWWPGDVHSHEPALYAYGYPQPEGIEQVQVRPDAAAWSDRSGEFFLAYDAVCESDDPGRRIHEFMESTYAEAARLMRWPETLTRP
jgi:uncharacterized protein DUF5996